jgi:hypothetical protein
MKESGRLNANHEGSTKEMLVKHQLEKPERTVGSGMLR